MKIFKEISRCLEIIHLIGMMIETFCFLSNIFAIYFKGVREVQVGKVLFIILA